MRRLKGAPYPVARWHGGKNISYHITMRKLGKACYVPPPPPIVAADWALSDDDLAALKLRFVEFVGSGKIAVLGGPAQTSGAMPSARPSLICGNRWP